jgi:TDG/mug DNA glycosylase family protein
MVPLVESFEPISSVSPVVLILGTAPSVKSLEESFYYGHPRNAFWPILFKIFNAKDQGTPSKKELIRENRLALWDVLNSCEREGSLDNAIQKSVANPIPDWISAHSSVSTIVFNGANAFRFYQKAFGKPMVQYHVLPGTSPANARYTFESKLQSWSILKELCAG